MYDQILKTYSDHRDPVRAEPMARYMKNRFPFLGLSRPERNALQADFIKKVRREESVDWDFVRRCWNQAEREFQYLGLDYIYAAVHHLQADDLPQLEALITAKSWWDTVDTIAVRLIGAIGLRFPAECRTTAISWAGGGNIWLVRSAILYQLKYKASTDTGLLAQIILSNNDSAEFFIDKAVGWALREYSKTDPDWVRQFIASQPLSQLSIREGSKYI